MRFSCHWIDVTFFSPFIPDNIHTFNDKPYKWQTWYFMHKWIDCINGFDSVPFCSLPDSKFRIWQDKSQIVNSITGRCWLLMDVSPTIYFEGESDESQKIAYRFDKIYSKEKNFCVSVRCINLYTWFTVRFLSFFLFVWFSCLLFVVVAFSR